MSDLDLALQAFNKAKAQGDVANAKRFAQIALDLDAGFAPPVPAYTPAPVDPTRPLPDAADRSVLREAIADPLLQVGKGAVTGTRFLSDVFGADNPISQKLSGVEDFIDDLLSAQAQTRPTRSSSYNATSRRQRAWRANHGGLAGNVRSTG